MIQLPINITHFEHTFIKFIHIQYNYTTCYISLYRYGLLKQRRVTSATGHGSTSVQPSVAVQRASSAVHIRQHHQADVTSPASQHVEEEGPQPIAQAYMPQDGGQF